MTSRKNDLGLYDRVADQWWSENSPLEGLQYLNPPRFRYFDRFVPTWDQQSVLDIGCGGGFTSEFLAKRGAQVSSVDLSGPAIEAAKAHALQSNLRIDYRQGVAESLPFPDSSFDVVVCVDVLEHVGDLNRAIAEMARVLKPGGIALFDTINRTFLSRIYMIWLMETVLGIIPKHAHDWDKFITPKELAAGLERYGFNHIETTGFNMWGRNPFNRSIKVAIGGTTQIMYIGHARKK